MNDMADKIIRLYSRLTSLKENLPSSVEEKYVRDYHSIVDELEKITSSNLSEFRLPEGEVRSRITSGNYLTGEKKYSKNRYCDKNFLLAKLDALLGYFQFRYLSEKKEEIGFKPHT